MTRAVWIGLMITCSLVALLGGVVMGENAASRRAELERSTPTLALVDWLWVSTGPGGLQTEGGHLVVPLDNADSEPQHFRDIGAECEVRVDPTEEGEPIVIVSCNLHGGPAAGMMVKMSNGNAYGAMTPPSGDAVFRVAVNAVPAEALADGEP